MNVRTSKEFRAILENIFCNNDSILYSCDTTYIYKIKSKHHNQCDEISAIMSVNYLKNLLPRYIVTV